MFHRPAPCMLVWIVLTAGIALTPQTLHSQYRKWSITGSVGYAVLNLDAVDNKNESDVEGWGRQGYPVGPFASVKRPLFYSTGVGYRVDREFGISLTASYWSRTVSTSYNDPYSSLLLDRGVASTDIVLGIAYYPSAQPFLLEWYIQANLGLAVARATGKAVGFQTEKTSGVTTTIQFVDTDGILKKTRTSAGLSLGANVPLFHGISLNAEAGYRFAQMGSMEGTVTRFGETTAETTTMEFNYSGFLLTVGIRLVL
jgi:hypothetical protein